MDGIAAPDSTGPARINGGKAHVFLTAEWRYLAMLNYELDPALLAPYVPAGTELDRFDGRAYVSLVGFRFLSTKILGIPIRFLRNFDEVNLRFYVRCCVDGVVKRGVVFIQEIVPRRAIAVVARLAYNENYRCLPMSHQISFEAGALRVEYAWRLGSIWNRLQVRAAGEPRAMPDGSAEQFIAEHYWGYSAQPRGRFCGVPRGSSTLASLGRYTRRVRGRCGGSLWSSVCERAEQGAGLGFSSGGISGDGLSWKRIGR